MKKTIVVIPLIFRESETETETEIVFHIVGWLEVLVIEVEITCGQL